MECIVLAGGLGTRLRSVIDDRPKCMAPVNGYPFLHYILDYLQSQGCERILLSLGYKHDYIIDWLETVSYGIEIVPVIEDQPLGTGGGIHLAMKHAQEQEVFVVNGDTFFDVPLQDMKAFHDEHNSTTTLALKPMYLFDRYGAVYTDDGNRIVAFEEKQPQQEGKINGGVYIIDRTAFLEKPFPEKFSFERDYLEKYIGEGAFYGYDCDGYFIDIGIPEDYERAQEDLKKL